MKKLILFLMPFLFMNNVQADSNPYKQAGPYGTNCTWYAWKMAYEKAGVALPGWGNAKEWYNDAKNSGYSVGKTPKANSIIVWGGWTSYGHVGYVEKVSGNTLYVWDSTGPCIDKNSQNYKDCIANSVSEDTDRICKQNAPKVACEYTISPDEYGITGYIYLNGVPQKSSYTAPKVETKKSNNANIKAIKLSDGKIEIKQDVLKYEVKVKNETDNLKVEATLEDEKTKIEGLGNYALKIGENEIKLKTIAEDGTSKEYILKVIRPIKNVKVNLKEMKNKNEKNNILPILYILLIVILIFVVIKGVKNGKNRKNNKKNERKKSKENKLDKSME